MGAEMFHADIRIDGHKDATKLTVAFHNFPNASKNQRDPQTYKHLIMQPTSKNLERP